jgi:hypothetical protein
MPSGSRLGSLILLRPSAHARLCAANPPRRDCPLRSYLGFSDLVSLLLGQILPRQTVSAFIFRDRILDDRGGCIGSLWCASSHAASPSRALYELQMQVTNRGCWPSAVGLSAVFWAPRSMPASSIAFARANRSLMPSGRTRPAVR